MVLFEPRKHHAIQPCFGHELNLKGKHKEGKSKRSNPLSLYLSDSSEGTLNPKNEKDGGWFPINHHTVATNQTLTKMKTCHRWFLIQRLKKY